MVVLRVTIDTQMAYWPNFRRVLVGGVITRAAGVLNLKWEEFSALDFARKAGLHEVDWDGLQDDTPGRIDLTIAYSSITAQELQDKLNDPCIRIGVMDYDLTENVERQTAETDC